jgi:hypothetical protein
MVGDGCRWVLALLVKKLRLPASDADGIETTTQPLKRHA